MAQSSHGFPFLLAFCVYHSRQQQLNMCWVFIGTNPCARSNGGCQQLCFHLGSGRRTCSCAHGRLAQDGFACERYEGYLLYSERTILKSIHLSDESDLNSPVQPFENPAFFKSAIALAFDYSQTTAGTNRIFYSDAHFGNIQMINDDWTGRSVVVESMFVLLLCSSAVLHSLQGPLKRL